MDPLSERQNMDHSKKTKEELVALCKEQGIKGYSGKKKADILLLLNKKPIEEPIAKEPTKNVSPLRYPGGKTRAIAILSSYVSTYFPTKKVLLSPFFGGGSFELFMTTKGYTVHGNDLFIPLYTFWTTKQSNCDTLVTAIKEHMPMTKEKFHTLRASILKEEAMNDQPAPYRQNPKEHHAHRHHDDDDDDDGYHRRGHRKKGGMSRLMDIFDF
jgi:hypothetical protein